MKFGGQKCDFVAETGLGRQSQGEGITRKPSLQLIGVSQKYQYLPCSGIHYVLGPNSC